MKSNLLVSHYDMYLSSSHYLLGLPDDLSWISYRRIEQSHSFYAFFIYTAEELKAKQQAKAAIPPRIPGARDANKKQAKYVSNTAKYDTGVCIM